MGGRDSRHLFSALGTQSQALHRSLSSACWTSRVNILRPGAELKSVVSGNHWFCGKCGALGRRPAQVKPNLLEWSLKLGSKHRRAKVEWLANKEAENWHRASTMATKALRASQGRTQSVGVSLISLPFTGACRGCSCDFTGLSVRSVVFFPSTRASTYLTAETV